MKLNKQEYQELVDSRLVELENAIKVYKDNEPIVTDAQTLDNLDYLVKCAEALYKAYEAKVEAELDECAEEAEKRYQETFGGDE